MRYEDTYSYQGKKLGGALNKLFLEIVNALGIDKFVSWIDRRLKNE